MSLDRTRPTRPTLILNAAALAWELVWSDEFDGEEINRTKWQHEITFRGGGVGDTCNNIAGN